MKPGRELDALVAEKVMICPVVDASNLPEAPGALQVYLNIPVVFVVKGFLIA